MGGVAILAIVLAALAVVVAIRLLPSDPTVWHQALSDQTQTMPGPCAEHVRPLTGGARAVCLRLDDPFAVLTKLSAIAADYPRTTVLAGSPDAGRITWVSRSRLMGFPDYITAEAKPSAQGTRLALYSRLRFGNSDLGVNAARLKAWLTALDQT